MAKMLVSDYKTFIDGAYGYYWMGTIGQMASWSLYYDLKKDYPKYYTASDFSKQIANPKPCYDCAGLVKSPFVYPKYNASYDKGATGIYNACNKKGKLSSESQLKPYYLVFKGNDKTKTHVAVYLGNGKIKEAKGHAYGVVISNLDLSKYKYWAEYYAVDYSDSVPTPEPVLKEGDILTVTTKYTELMLRAYASTSAPILQRLKKGSKVVYQGKETDNSVGHWLMIKYNNVIGWACSKENKKDYNYLTKL